MHVHLTVDEAYLELLKNVVCNFDIISSPRGQEVREIFNYTFKVTNPISQSIKTKDEERNKKIEDYTKKEMDWYLSCHRSVESAASISRFWNNLANPDGTINSNYGYLALKDKSEGDEYMELLLKNECTYLNAHPLPTKTPWEWARTCLIKDKDSRQAIMRINKPSHAWCGNKDFPCTMHANFHIRNNMLNMTVVMRSNDVVRGTVYDVPFFIYLQERMISELNTFYPELKIGTYTHIAHSMHMYEKDLETVLKMIG